MTAEGYEIGIGEETKSICYYGTSLITRSETTLRLYFRVRGALEEFSASIDGQETPVVDAGNGFIYIELTNISARNLADAHSFTVMKGDEAVTVSGCSAFSYVQLALESEEAEDGLKMAVKALKRYGDLAVAYFTENESQG